MAEIDLTDDTVLRRQVEQRFAEVDQSAMVSSATDGVITALDTFCDLAAVMRPLLAAAWEQGVIDADTVEWREVRRMQRAEGDGAANPFGWVWRG